MIAVENRIEQLQKEISERRAELVELLKADTLAVVDDYSLLGSDGGPVRLSELFGDMDDLIVVHNMGRRCAYCTLWADGFNGVLQHIESRAAFVVVSPDRPDVQREFAESRGWRFRMASSAESDFTREMGYSVVKDGQTFYLPGYSTFHRSADGVISRVGRDDFGPGDPYCATFHMFDMLEGGPGGWTARFDYSE